MELEVYTDGACKGNPGPGGAGVVILDNNKIVKKCSIGLGDCTNNIAELSAIGLGLKYAFDYSSESDVIIYSDSNLCINVLSGLWKAKKNIDLILEVKELMQRHNSVTFVKVKAHDGDQYNELADALASQACYE